MTAVHIAARLLGSFELEIDGRRLQRAAFERPSGMRLLKLLLATPDHRVRREVAAELLWPEADPERSAGNLRKAVHFARRAIADLAEEEAVIATDGEWLGFAPGVRLDIDADRLVAALSEVEDRAPATPSRDDNRRTMDVLQRIAAMGGLELLPEDPYEEWLVPLRERLRDRVMAATLSGVMEARRVGQPELAAQLAERALAIDPADESAHQSLIELHLEGGRLHAARRQLLACRRALAETYGVEPSAELVALVDAAGADRTRVREDVVREPEIVGRRLELDRAEAALDAVASGRPGSLLIRGPAGIGKSRLLREVVRLGAAGGWRVLDVHGLELTSDTAFGPLGDALARQVDVDVVAAWPEPARSAALTIAPQFDERAASPEPPRSRERRQIMAFATDAGLRAGLVDGLRRLSAERPLILAADDLQWLDPATIELLRAVVELDAAILTAATLRDEPGDRAPGIDALVHAVERRGGTQLRVAPMGQRELQLLVEHQLAGAGLGPPLASAVAELSGGIPLYALQLVRGAQESGAISLRDGQWAFATGAGALPVPESVRRTVEVRAGRLAPDVRSILGVAAELGDDVSYELVVAAADAAPEVVLEALDRGLELGLVVERGGRYRFGHPLFRAVLRDDVPRRSRAMLHGRIAVALAGGADPTDEAAIAAAVAAGADVVGAATHAAAAVALGNADVLPLAVGFGFAAGARQNALFDHAGAVTTLRQALRLWQQLPVAGRSAFRVSASHHRLGLALKAVGDPAGAAEAFRAEIATSTNDMDRARGYAALAWLPYEHARFERSAALLREGIAEVEDPIARAFLESGLGWIRGRQGDWKSAYALLEPAIAILEDAPADVLARALDRFAVAIRDLGMPQRSIPVFRRALTLCAETANLHEEAIVRMHLATALRDAGDAPAGRAQVARAIELTRLTGDRYIEAVSHWILAEIEDTAGRLEAAASARTAELSILEAIGGNPQNQAMAHAHLAHLASRMGARETSRAEAEAARAVAAHAGLEYLPGLVERAITAEDWFKVAHRHHEDAEGPGAAAEGPRLAADG